MTLVKWKASDVFPHFDPLWDDLFNRGFVHKGVELGTTIPAVNIDESDKDFQLEVAVPGLKKEDLKIDLEHDMLTISCEKRDEKEEKDGTKVTRREFNYTVFQRSFQLPDNVDKTQISAEYIDGLLKLSLPKKQLAQVEGKQQVAIR